jgi:hypothetical protein
MKCLPLKNLTRGFAAVRLMRASGWKFFPGPDSGGPVSMFHDDGASTARTGSLVVSNASMTFGKGSRTSPEKEKPGLVSPWNRYECKTHLPKMESTMRSVSLSADGKSSVKGMSRSFSCLVRRCSGPQPCKCQLGIRSYVPDRAHSCSAWGSIL